MHRGDLYLPKLYMYTLWYKTDYKEICNGSLSLIFTCCIDRNIYVDVVYLHTYVRSFLNSLNYNIKK